MQDSLPGRLVSSPPEEHPGVVRVAPEPIPGQQGHVSFEDITVCWGRNVRAGVLAGGRLAAPRYLVFPPRLQNTVNP